MLVIIQIYAQRPNYYEGAGGLPRKRRGGLLDITVILGDSHQTQWVR